MKLTQVILFVLTPVAIFMLLACTAKATASIPVIYETDITLDCDDVGALAVLHGLQNEGKVNIHAVCYNEVHPSGAAAIDAINTWYGRGDIPVGVYKGRLSNPDRSRYLEALTHFPHDLDNERAASALDTYRQVLADQPDRSVTIISVGFLNNLYDLLKDPGSYALVEKKVKLLVAMGGLNNDGFNFSRHGLVDQTQYVIENWPGTLVTTHVGGSMITGQTLTATTPVNNPVRRAYELHRGPNTGRSSWDQVSVLYAAYGTQWFNETWAGGGSLRNGYTWKFKNGYRGYAAPKDDSQVKDEIERLMTLAPQGTRPRVIVMTDGEVDDRSSMIRFLLYTCDVDVRAIIETNSMFQRHGHSDDPWYENQLGATLESEVIRDAAVGGETIYVATDDHGLAIVDASNNEDLRAVGYYREGESVQAVSVQGRQAYISYADRIEMLDISDGQRVKLQRSANLVDWEDWQTMTLGGNATGCGLIDATTATPQRFYRAVEGMPRPTDEP